MILKASKRLRKFFNNVLTDEMIWHEIIEDKSLSNIHQLRRLNREAAQALIGLEKRMELLSLGITELPPDVAEELASYKGEKLFLNCVLSLPVESAEMLSHYQGSKLMLNGIKTLSLPVLGRLAPYRGSLYLEGVESLEIKDRDVRRAQVVFNNLKFAKLSLSSLSKASLNQLKAFARFPGLLELNGIKKISENDAEILGESITKSLSFKGIERLSFDLMKLFTQFKGFLDLSGATEVDRQFLHILAARPARFSLYSWQVKHSIEEYKEEESRKKLKKIKENRNLELQEKARLDDAEKRNADILKEFERFDSIAPEPVLSIPDAYREGCDPYSPEIEDEVIVDIELNLNREIEKKKVRVDQLLAKGFSRLTEKEKELLQELRDQIEVLKGEIRGALDILVEKKELGSIVFNSSEDLIAYLKESGAEDDTNDALEHIEDIDMFGNSFEEIDSEDNSIESGSDAPLSEAVEGVDFVLRAV